MPKQVCMECGDFFEQETQSNFCGKECADTYYESCDLESLDEE